MLWRCVAEQAEGGHAVLVSRHKQAVSSGRVERSVLALACLFLSVTCADGCACG